MKPPIAVSLKLDQRRLPAEVFNRISARSGGTRLDWRKAWQNFGKPGRDPDKLDGVMSFIARSDDWTPHLKIAQLHNHWDQVVGKAIAQHSEVTDLSDGILTIRTSSNSWATQLTYLIPQLTDTIRRRLDGLDIRQIRVTGPQSHSFAPRMRRRYPRR